MPILLLLPLATEESAGITPFLIGGGALAAAPRRAGRHPGLRQGTRALLSTARPATRRRRVGVMGGTFDPIHHGHLVAASEVQAWFDLDEVVFVPTGEPWQKSERVVSPAEHRYLMTVIATASNPRFKVSRVDIDRGGPTYTIDTLRDLTESMPGRPTSTSSPAPTRWPRSSPGATPTSCSTWRGSWAAPAPATRWTRAPWAEIPQRPRHDPGDPGAGDLLDRVPRAPRQGRAGLVPRARRRGAVHRQARPLRTRRPRRRRTSA